jgi:NAD-dependent deacetylase
MSKKQKIVVFTGAGVSAESGLKTFRDGGGLWEEYNVMDVATPEAWSKDPAMVLDFYNKRRKQVIEAKPNDAHYALAELEKKYDVHIITQNIDNLHERAGSKKVLHLHGEIIKSRSSIDPTLIYPIKGWEIKMGQKCEKGSQLRPHIVWFGEMVPHMEEANLIAAAAEIFIIIGTSLFVYPAAGLVDYAPHEIPKYLIDPNETKSSGIQNLTLIKEKAGKGMKQLLEILMK